MAASKFLSGVAIRFKLGTMPPSESLTNSKPVAKLRAIEFELVGDPLGGERPSLNRMAAPNMNLDAAIRASFAGQVYILWSSLRPCFYQV
ncbi:hypothetical protein Pst134EA_012990 [Puccinia striiformis f. sp. tritici]|uniref:hypothetical protein n=1 Tax=Puccinia striiformis f. sp. tritici TaxID=168172 RepID=UPI0020073A3E|nr:hypothetical protein Pst134EA_012990 [Puccinia striiformis f. sp. tritici]KAH9465093.1 hypothetical protein Pst134EA_012990 [Puccinia striiformis f. sp. tritici]